MPTISIIVPVYNTEKYLHRCIDSILNQTYADFELLLINDGSKDNSGVICDEYEAKDSRVKVFHKLNEGASSARNLGIDNANGEYISFVDSDDYVLPYFLETFVECMNGSDLCMLGILPDYSFFSGYQIKKSSLDYRGTVMDALFLLYECDMFGSLANKIFKKSIIQDNGLRLNVSFTFKEDEEFLLRFLLYAKTISATEKPCYVYFVPNWSIYKSVDNFYTILSRYCSIVNIYQGKANKITDSYQIELLSEWFSILRNNFRRSLILLPILLKSIGLRIFRILPLEAMCEKVVFFLKKNIRKGIIHG